MSITDDIIDAFLDNPPEIFYGLIKNDSNFHFLQDLQQLKILGNELIRQGYYFEVVCFTDYAVNQENIFDKPIASVIDIYINFYSQSLYNLGEYDKLIKICNKFINEYENEINLKLSCLNGISISRKKKADFIGAYRCLLEVIKIVSSSDRKEELQIDLYLAYTNLGSLFFEIELFEHSYTQFQKALEVINKIGYNTDKAITLLNISDVLFALNKIDKALLMIEKSIAVYKQKEAKFDVFIYKLARLYKAKYLLKAERNQEAKDILDDFLPVTKNTEPLVKIEALHRHLVLLFNENKYSLFNKYFDKHHHLLIEDKSYKFLEDLIVKAIKISEHNLEEKRTKKLLSLQKNLAIETSTHKEQIMKIKETINQL